MVLMLLRFRLKNLLKTMFYYNDENRMSIKLIAKELLSRFPFLDGLFRRFIWSRFHFSEIEMRFLDGLQAGSADVAVDVGAAMGSYSWILNRVSKQVFAFEPGLIHNKYLNNVSFGTGINVIRAAVGSDCSSVNMYTPGLDTDARHSATLSRENPVVNSSGTNVDLVDQITLDSFFSNKLAPGRSIDILKVDVEGYELEVFRGAIGVLSKSHPIIICEIEARHNVGYPKVFKLLRGLGYNCYIDRAGIFESFVGERIEDLQLEGDLAIRLGTSYDPKSNKYINNFVFQHPESRVKVKSNE